MTRPLLRESSILTIYGTPKNYVPKPIPDEFPSIGPVVHSSIFAVHIQHGTSWGFFSSPQSMFHLHDPPLQQRLRLGCQSPAGQKSWFLLRFHWNQAVTSFLKGESVIYNTHNHINRYKQRSYNITYPTNHHILPTWLVAYVMSCPIFFSSMELFVADQAWPGASNSKRSPCCLGPIHGYHYAMILGKYGKVWKIIPS